MNQALSNQIKLQRHGSDGVRDVYIKMFCIEIFNGFRNIYGDFNFIKKNFFIKKTEQKALFYNK